MWLGSLLSKSVWSEVLVGRVLSNRWSGERRVDGEPRAEWATAADADKCAIMYNTAEGYDVTVDGRTPIEVRENGWVEATAPD